MQFLLFPIHRHVIHANKKQYGSIPNKSASISEMDNIYLWHMHQLEGSREKGKLSILSQNVSESYLILKSIRKNSASELLSTTTDVVLLTAK